MDLNNLNIDALLHPEYQSYLTVWEKWRATYESGDAFIQGYLEKFSIREDNTDFETRKGISYVPAFAKAAVNDVKDSIFQRIADVTRGGGPQSYQDAVKGLVGGVDLAGTSMNSFIGSTLLSELLVMEKVGVFVDMPEAFGETLIDQQNIHPYIYHYKAEDILNWVVDTKNNKTYSRLLLRDRVYSYCEVTGLPKDAVDQYRFLWVEDGRVKVQFYDSNSQTIDRNGELGTDIIELNIPTIPFVLFQISDSLMRDIANYQIALVNLASSDIAYSLKSNFPFYVEQYDPRSVNLFGRTAGQDLVQTGETSVQVIQGGESADAPVAKNQELAVGSTVGRRVAKGLDLPAFIHPSSEPLKASMEKQEELKRDIRVLVKLTVASLASKMASAESKGFDERGLEAGLSAIGLELEQGERLIANYWQLYGGESKEQPTVKYPQKYSLQSDKDKRDEGKDLLQAATVVPSVKFKKEAMKQAAHIALSSKVSHEKMQSIFEEIDAADVVVNPEELHRDIELGLIDLKAASQAKGYPDGAVDKAAQDHADRVQRIAESQAKARGATDMSGLANVSRDEKMEKAAEPVPGEKTRGLE